jgi:hypothetical protein
MENARIVPALPRHVADFLTVVEVRDGAIEDLLQQNSSRRGKDLSPTDDATRSRVVAVGSEFVGQELQASRVSLEQMGRGADVLHHLLPNGKVAGHSMKAYRPEALVQKRHLVSRHLADIGDPEWKAAREALSDRAEEQPPSVVQLRLRQEDRCRGSRASARVACVKAFFPGALVQKATMGRLGQGFPWRDRHPCQGADGVHLRSGEPGGCEEVSIVRDRSRRLTGDEMHATIDCRRALPNPEPR